MAKILIIEDDLDLSGMIEDLLTQEHQTVELVADGLTAWEILQQGSFDLIVLDWDLPHLSGIEILKRFRAAGGKAPVIMLTGKGEIADKEKSFGHGVDDYLSKPFSMKELALRVRALLRRAPTAITNQLTVGDLVLDTVKHKVTKTGKEVHLLPRDFALLEFFMRHPDEIYSSESLLARVWHQDSDASPEGLRVAIRRLRKVIDTEDNVANSMIENVPRVGYRLRI